MGYYFYYPLENKIFVARYAEFFKTNLIKQEASGSIIDFNEIQIEDAQPFENTSLHQHEVEHDTVEPQTDWLEAMNAEMKSMKDNQVWNLVDLPPNCKTIRSKWIFKKKTDMDGNIHTYKARLVAKGFTQTYRVDYEETFSPVTDIKAIRILIAIAAYYDYEICQIDVKIAFLNDCLNEDIYMVQPEGFVNPKHPRRVCMLQRSIYGLKKASRSWNKRFDEEIKKYGESHWTAVKNILEYLRNTKDMFLVYGVTLYTDASWEIDRDDLRSQTGFVFMMNEGAVDWKSSKQSTTAMSSIEAEYITAAEAAMEAIWIHKFIFGLGVIPSIDKPMDMYYDNTSAINIANEPGVQKGAKHFR
ncbi:zinc finger, CCHC-type containing protein [Tanacetum coccineum]